jgi:electron transport complex protein RnfG
VEVYLAKRGGEPVAVILPVLAKEGYTGPIRLIVGIAPDGRILGVRVVEHKETPGLGDKIDIKKSDWILGFNGRSLGNPDQAGWQVKKDGGEFDALTGATITPRAVVKAVHAALMFFDTHQQQLTLAQPGQILHLETPHGTH